MTMQAIMLWIPVAYDMSSCVTQIAGRVYTSYCPSPGVPGFFWI